MLVKSKTSQNEPIHHQVNVQLIQPHHKLAYNFYQIQVF
jgi:hypothetical protein